MSPRRRLLGPLETADGMLAREPHAAWVRRAWPWLVLLLLASLGCNRGLWTPDEPREAEIAREMALAPSLIPRLDGQPFTEKPPLYYWVVAAAYRLEGGPSALAARSVSAAAGLGTLWLLYCWVRRARSRGAALTAVFMLATSEQFLVSSHWVLLDPLLVLMTTLAAWAAWTLLTKPTDDGRVRALFYAALILALWIKGPIGLLLVGAGLAAYCLLERPAAWRRLWPLRGTLLLAGMLVGLGVAVYAVGGRTALWNWAYVNQLQRLLAPGATGHREPLLYYAWTLPYTVLPWLPAVLWALGPSQWQRVATGPDLARYGAIVALAMVLLLSLAATKRETYLLPALPLLFVCVGIRAHAWSQRGLQWGTADRLLWGAQVLLLCLYAPAAPLAAWIWRGTPTAFVIGGLCIGIATSATLVALCMTDRRRTAAQAALLTAIVASAVLLALAGPVLNRTKDMRPFMLALGQRLPAKQAVFALHVDETLEAEVPFYTGRVLLSLDRRQGGPLPRWVLVQGMFARPSDPLPPSYHLVMYQAFGPGRSLALWHTDRPTRP